jgi:hypothetical protein
MIGSPRTRKLGKKILKKQRNEEKNKFSRVKKRGTGKTVVIQPKQTKRVTGTVGEGAAGKKAKETQHAGGQSLSEKSQVTRTSKNVFEKSNSKTQYFVREVKGRRCFE